MLFDNHGRPLNYLRLAVTDRCNLRCFYCMPAEGIDYLPRKALLSYEEMERLVAKGSQPDYAVLERLRTQLRESTRAAAGAPTGWACRWRDASDR